MRLLLFILLLLAGPLVHAQDSLAVSFTEEQDSLPKQRFVDRYENVFMTKVPTRHMFKLGLTFLPDYMVSVEKSVHENTQYDLGYEFKMLPSWSVGAELGANGGWATEGRLTGMLTAKLYSRWYYDMRRRISEGKSVNNFTGNFVAVVAERLWGTENVDYRVNKIGLEFGLQRRFFTQSRLELGIGVFYQDYNRSESPYWMVYDVSKSSRFAIASRTSMGLAFGDWKRNKNQAFCEVFTLRRFCAGTVEAIMAKASSFTKLFEWDGRAVLRTKDQKQPVLGQHTRYCRLYEGIHQKLAHTVGGEAGRLRSAISIVYPTALLREPTQGDPAWDRWKQSGWAIRGPVHGSSFLPPRKHF
jgi:hypothetical protein